MSRRAGWVLALVSTAVLVGVLGLADRYADGDMGHLVAVEVRLAQLLRAGDLGAAARFWWALVTPQPPVGYLPGIVAFTVFGVRPFIAALTMGLALLVTWDALWRIWGARAWMAWVPIVTSPLVWIAVEQHGRDLLSGAAVLEAASWLLATRGFTDRRASLLFGAWLGVGFLTKYTFPIFALFTCLAGGLGLLGHTLRDRAGAAGRWRNLAWGVAGFVGLAGAWYAQRGGPVLEYAMHSSGDELASNTSNFRDPSSLASLVYYPLALRDALSLPGVVLVGLAGVVGLLRREDRAATLVCLATAFGGVAVLSALPAAVDRYAIPAFLALAALLPALGVRWMAALPVLGVFLVQGGATVRRFAPDAPSAPAKYDHPADSWTDLAWPSPPATYLPSDLVPSRWRLDEAATAIRAAQGRPDGTIGFLSASGPVGAPTFAMVLLEASLKGYRYDFATINTRGGPGGHDVFVGPLYDGTFPSSAFTTLLVVWPSGGDEAIDRWLATHPVVEAARFPCSDGSVSAVYRLGAGASDTAR